MGRGKLRTLGVVRTWATCVVVLAALAARAPAATYTWTGGGGVSTNWSNAANWGGAAPSNNETGVELIFPALNAPYASNNDLTGLHVTSLGITAQLGAGNYTFTGNPITLDGPVTMASPSSGNPNLVWLIPVVLGGDVTFSTSGRQTQLQGPIDLGSNTLTLDTLGDIVLAGVVSGSGNLIKNNTSALTITSTNTYPGSTTGNRGALYIASAAAFGGTGTGTTFNGGFLGFVPGSMFTTSEPFVFNGGNILAYGTPTMAGQVTLNTTINIQAFVANAILTIGGTIAGTGGLNKTGPGLVILNAPTDPYAGATGVDNGTLRLDTALSSTNAVTVKSGATLQGNGSSGGTLSVENGGTIAPGSSPGVLASSGLTMVAGAIFAAEIDGPNAITQYDRIAVSGPVSLGGATLAVTLGYAPPDGQQFTLISQLQGQSVTGTFAALPEGATFQVDGTTFGITYTGGSGNDVVLIAGPPHTPTSTATELVPTNTPTSPPTPTTTFTSASTATPTPTTQTQLPTATSTSSLTPTSASATPTFTPTPTPSIIPTPTATEMAPLCTGDCDGNGSVAINELVVGVNIALDHVPATVCPRFDADGNGLVTIPELIAAVGNALTDCPGVATVGSRTQQQRLRLVGTHHAANP